MRALVRSEAPRIRGWCHAMLLIVLVVLVALIVGLLLRQQVQQAQQAQKLDDIKRLIVSSGTVVASRITAVRST